MKTPQPVLPYYTYLIKIFGSYFGRFEDYLNPIKFDILIFIDNENLYCGNLTVSGEEYGNLTGTHIGLDRVGFTLCNYGGKFPDHFPKTPNRLEIGSIANFSGFLNTSYTYIIANETASPSSPDEPAPMLESTEYEHPIRAFYYYIPNFLADWADKLKGVVWYYGYFW